MHSYNCDSNNKRFTPYSTGTIKAAFSSVYCTLTGLDFLMKGFNSFVLCRPPGHHAGWNYSQGICYLNNVTIAAKYIVSNGFSVSILDFDVRLSQSRLYIKGLPYAIRISPNCTGLWGGFFVFIAVVSTLPAPSFRRRFLWIVIGVFILTSTNLIRIVIVIALCLMDPTRFHFFHTISQDINIFIGGVLSLIAVRSLFLGPLGIRAFRSSESRVHG